MERITNDTEAVDAIAALLGEAGDWSSAADYLEEVANIIGAVRPHPGEAADQYAATFAAQTGRTAPQ